ncbi:hypothetical protein EVAR_83599_1 [Eumeta japonica]|uniref:Uncharacterized protein n=1 Tax=Eumeta variegata TaxID=151549 RepID=A0A4C1UNQ6_EUMVA|nr:hypothetical protein EVAR_83599_1 [Eumeta japonica]
MENDIHKFSLLKAHVCLREFGIDVASDNQREHEQAHHNHYLLLHNGQTRHTLVTNIDTRAPGVAGASSNVSEHTYIHNKKSKANTTDKFAQSYTETFVKRHTAARSLAAFLQRFTFEHNVTVVGMTVGEGSSHEVAGHVGDDGEPQHQEAH